MTLPTPAKDIIAQAIYRNSVMASLYVKKEQLALMVAAIEYGLDAAGYVLLTRKELGEDYDQADEADYEDGQ
jgi:hypothetical protein